MYISLEEHHRQRNSRYKISDIELVCSQSTEEAKVAGMGCTRGRTIGDETREVGPCRPFYSL